MQTGNIFDHITEEAICIRKRKPFLKLAIDGDIDHSEDCRHTLVFFSRNNVMFSSSYIETQEICHQQKAIGPIRVAVSKKKKKKLLILSTYVNKPPSKTCPIIQNKKKTKQKNILDINIKNKHLNSLITYLKATLCWRSHISIRPIVNTNETTSFTLYLYNFI